MSVESFKLQWIMVEKRLARGRGRKRDVERCIGNKMRGREKTGLSRSEGKERGKG